MNKNHKECDKCSLLIAKDSEQYKIYHKSNFNKLLCSKCSNIVNNIKIDEYNVKNENFILYIILENNGNYPSEIDNPYAIVKTDGLSIRNNILRTKSNNYVKPNEKEKYKIVIKCKDIIDKIDDSSEIKVKIQDRYWDEEALIKNHNISSKIILNNI